MSNGNAALALALGAGAGVGLWYLLRDDDEKAATGSPETGTGGSAPNATTPGTQPPAPCSLRLDVKGLTSDGVAIDIPTAVTKCQAAGRADLVLADDAPSTVYADLASAFKTAGILISERRNARARTKRRRRRQSAPGLDFFAATVRALADQIDENPTAEGLARGRFGRKVFLAAIRRALRRTEYANLSRAAVDRLFVDANREGLLELARADLVAVMDPAEVRDSEIQHMMSSWHFVVAPRAGSPRGSRTARPPRYLAWCGTCYSGARLETNSRREADAHATSHMRLYPGHDVHVTDRRKERARDERNATSHPHFTLRMYPDGTQGGAQVRHFHADPATSWKDAYYRLIAAGIVDARRAGRTHEPGGWMLSVDPADYRTTAAEALP